MLLALTVAAGIGAQETPPNRTPAAATKDGRGASELNRAENAANTKKPDGPQLAVPSCIQCLNCCPVEQPQSNTQEEKAKEATLDRLYRRYLGATIIGVVGGFIGIGLIVWQTILVRRSANAARLNAEAVINSERAWLLIEEIRLSDLPADTAALIPQPVSYAVRVRNYGGSPAFVTEAQCKLESRALRDASDKPLDERIYEVEEKRQQRIVPPGEDFWLKPWDTKFLSPAEIDAINCIGQERAFFFAHGIIKYVDAFNRTHHTRFNYRYDIKYFSQPAPAGFYLSESPRGSNDWT